MESISLDNEFSNCSKLADTGRWFVNHFVREVSRELPPGSRILDAGAGECAYKAYFRHCDYKAVDLGIGEEKWNYGKLDYKAPLDKLPLPDNSFDAILCTQVLEHLERPRESVSEFYRVLKVGGKLYLTAPMAQAQHQAPYDFFRYTSFGLLSIISEAGFGAIRIEPFGGIFTRWAYELPRALDLFPKLRSPLGRVSASGIAALPLKALCFVIIRISQCLLLALDPLDHRKDDPLGWSALAAKK